MSIKTILATLLIALSISTGCSTKDYYVRFNQGLIGKNFDGNSIKDTVIKVTTKGKKAKIFIKEKNCTNYFRIGTVTHSDDILKVGFINVSNYMYSLSGNEIIQTIFHVPHEYYATSYDIYTKNVKLNSDQNIIRQFDSIMRLKCGDRIEEPINE